MTTHPLLPCASWRAIAVVTLIAVTPMVTAYAQQENQAPSRVDESQPETINALIDKVERSWWDWKRVVKDGQQPENSPATTEFLGLIHEEQIGRLESFSEAAVLEGRRQLNEGNLATARNAFELARQLDRQQGAALWDLGRVQRRAGGQFGQSLSNSWNGLKAPFKGYWSRYASLANALTWTLVGLLASGAGLIVALLLRHAPRLVHDIDERLPPRWDASWRVVVGWAIVLSPLAAVVLGVWALVLWAVLLIPACGAAERRLIYGWLLLLAITVPAINAMWVLTSVAVSPTARVAVASAERSLRADLVTELSALADAHPDEATWKVLLARLIAGGQPDQAAHLLREAAQLAPTDARARLLLGNVLYRIGKHEAAGVLYREALDLDPKSAVAMFNLARVRMETNDWQAAEEMRHKATALDPSLVKRLDAGVASTEIAEPEFSASEVATSVLEEQAVPGLRRALRPANAITLTALAALLGAAVLRLRAGRVLSERCPRCGRARCGRCPGEAQASHGPLCAACDGLFSRREGLSPQARREQAAHVDRYLRRTGNSRAIVNLLWPGVAQIHEGRTLLGFALASLFAIGVTAWCWPQQILPTGPLIGIWPPGRAALIAVGLIWLISQLPPLRPLSMLQRTGR
ncbi:MAG: tetratricopeptide repeat protein [Acidobacteriota bacterium]